LKGLCINTKVKFMPFPVISSSVSASKYNPSHYFSGS
jgi:hypothetical protein